MQTFHIFSPIYTKKSKILILGSFPSVQSRKKLFYYMHPQNRFWKVLSIIYDFDFVHATIEEKINALYQYDIALYDVIESCTIKGSSDASIQNVVPAKLDEIIQHSSVQKIFLNGNKAYTLFCRYFPQYLSIAQKLPSTSPANATFSLERLILEWKKIKEEK